MRITKIEIEGREGRYATIARRRPGRWIEVTILTPYQPDGQIHRIAANADGEEFRRQARNLQTTIDGRRWCMTINVQKDLLRLLLTGARTTAKMCGVRGKPSRQGTPAAREAGNEERGDGHMSKATELIERSISHNEIAHAPYDATVAEALAAAADDSVENGDVTEYWGVDDDGPEWRVWRVHLDR